MRSARRVGIVAGALLMLDGYPTVGPVTPVPRTQRVVPRVAITAVYVDAIDPGDDGEANGQEGEPTRLWPRSGRAHASAHSSIRTVVNPAFHVSFSGPLEQDFDMPAPPGGVPTVDLLVHPIVRLVEDRSGHDVQLSAFYMVGAGSARPCLEIYPQMPLTPGRRYHLRIAGLHDPGHAPVPPFSTSLRTISMAQSSR
jgi:hypothetical protein